MQTLWDRRTNNFDFLRLLLAVLVIYSHSYALGLGSEAREPFMLLTHGQMSGGVVAVDLFFIMSGFLITASAERSRGFLDFLKKRVLRIYPGFVANALLAALVGVPLAGAIFVYRGWPARLGDFLLQTLRLREFSYAGSFPGNPYPNVIDGATWTIPYEFWCYIGVALLAATGMLRRRAVVLGLFVFSLVLSLLFRVEGWILGGKQLGLLLGPPQIWARFLPVYLAGVVFYLYRDRIRMHVHLVLLALAALVLGSQLRFGCTLLFPIAGAYLIFCAAFNPRVRLWRFGRFGDFSYGTYLYAFPIQQLLMKGFGHAVSPALLFVSATPITLLFAVASWYLVERRFLQPARRKETLAHALEHELTPAGSQQLAAARPTRRSREGDPPSFPSQTLS